MKIALQLLGFLVATSVALPFIDGRAAQSLLTAAMAVAVAAIGLTTQPRAISLVLAAVRPALIGALALALWMCLQLAPVAIFGLAHPIWRSAEDALGTSLAGTISIDFGATVLALASWALAITVMFVSAAVASDRRQARQILTALTAATAVIALEMILAGLFGVSFLDKTHDPASNGADIDSAAVGLICAAAWMAQTIERYTRRGRRSDTSPLQFAVELTFGLSSIALCAVAIALNATPIALFGVAIGLALFAVVFVVRKFAFGLTGLLAALAILAMCVIAFFAFHPAPLTNDVTLAFADAPKAAISLTQRMLGDLRWTGSGAGTFSSLEPIYRGAGDAAIGAAPTAAAAIVIELGRPALWFITTALVVLSVLLVRGALQRGRDFVYPAAGAGCIVGLVFLSFSNVGIYSTAVTIIAATALGMALAQRESPQ